MIDQWGWPRRVSFARTHRLMCNMTYLGHHVTSRDLYLRPNFDIFWSTRSYFDLPRREEYDGVLIISQVYIVQKLFAKKMLKKRLF